MCVLHWTQVPQGLIKCVCAANSIMMIDIECAIRNRCVISTVLSPLYAPVITGKLMKMRRVGLSFCYHMYLCDNYCDEWHKCGKPEAHHEHSISSSNFFSECYVYSQVVVWLTWAPISFVINRALWLIPQRGFAAVKNDSPRIIHGNYSVLSLSRLQFCPFDVQRECIVCVMIRHYGFCADN